MAGRFYKDGDLTRAGLFCLGLGAVIFKVLLSLSQFATIYPPLAPLDDDLMYRRAVSITQGEWLGPYGHLTLGKHSFFALWLALLHTLHIPYLAGNMALWALARRVRTLAFSPFFRKNIHRLIFFLLLLFNPAASATYATRIYRDSIFPALCLVFFSLCILLAERLLRGKRVLLRAALCGAVFGCIYLCREDGVWVLPFFIRATGISLGLGIYFGKKGRCGAKISKFFTSLMGFALSALLVIGAWRYQNYRYYGRFIISDFDRGEFKRAYGAMTSLRQDSWDSLVAVPRDVRERLYRQIPSFAPVKDALRDPLIENGYKNRRVGDYTSGSFYWALRQALANLGVYDTPQKSKEYFQNLYSRIEKAVAEGKLETRDGSGKLRNSITPPLKSRYVLPVIEETGRGLWLTATFGRCDPLAEMAVGRPDEIEPVEDFIRQKGATVLVENTETPYLSPGRAVSHGLLRAIRAVYRVITPVFLAISVLWQIKALISDLRHRRMTREGFLDIILLGVLGMAVLRCAMIAFVEVSSFGIGTYVMYLSTVHPLLIIYRAAGGLKTFEY